MIYTKKANFPYPILMNHTDDYINPGFELDVNIRDDINNFIIDVEWDISSGYIKKLLRAGTAKLVLIIKSKDNQFHMLSYSKTPQVLIPKNKLCINARTVMQLMIQLQEDIDFSDHTDLNTFYDVMKADIHIKAGNALGFSNTVIFDGSQNKPYELFEKKVDPKITSDVEIRLTNETIVIVYKKEVLQFAGLQNSKELNYPYIYMGLQKALMNFIIQHSAENPEEGIDISEMEPPENALEMKLYSLMQAKNVAELNINNLDEVIYRITDNMIMKYHEAVRGLGNVN